mmetsp:Transcript_26703/g.66948  ORF Transcript_26703/g.66948 Transcript_26703/m.66948 type:complete len:289 (+) Transcript_26703:92-958(+)
MQSRDSMTRPLPSATNQSKRSPARHTLIEPVRPLRHKHAVLRGGIQRLVVVTVLRRENVDIARKEVLRVVLPLDLFQPLEIHAVRHLRGAVVVIHVRIEPRQRSQQIAGVIDPLLHPLARLGILEPVPRKRHHKLVQPMRVRGMRGRHLPYLPRIMLQHEDPLLRARLDDLDDIVHRKCHPRRHHPRPPVARNPLDLVHLVRKHLVRLVRDRPRLVVDHRRAPDERRQHLLALHRVPEVARLQRHHLLLCAQRERIQVQRALPRGLRIPHVLLKRANDVRRVLHFIQH